MYENQNGFKAYNTLSELGKSGKGMAVVHVKAEIFGNGYII